MQPYLLCFLLLNVLMLLKHSPSMLCRLIAVSISASPAHAMQQNRQHQTLPQLRVSPICHSECIIMLYCEFSVYVYVNGAQETLYNPQKHMQSYQSYLSRQFWHHWHTEQKINTYFCSYFAFTLIYGQNAHMSTNMSMWSFRGCTC